MAPTVVGTYANPVPTPWITSTKTILDSGMEASRCPSTHIVDATMPKPSNAGTRIPTRSTSHPATGIDTATPTAAGARRSPTSWASSTPDHLQLNRKKVETDELGDRKSTRLNSSH